MIKKLTNSDLSPHWKYSCPRGRFYTCMNGEIWQVVDTKYGLCFTFEDGKNWQQIKGMWFCKNYVRIHGDINFNSMPYSIWDKPHWDKDNDPRHEGE